MHVAGQVTESRKARVQSKSTDLSRNHAWEPTEKAKKNGMTQDNNAAIKQLKKNTNKLENSSESQDIGHLKVLKAFIAFKFS